MAAGEASVDICSLLGLEMICVVPVGWPRIWAGEVECWDGGGLGEVLMTSGKRGRRGSLALQTSIRLGNGFGKNGLALRESVRTYSVQ